MKRLEIPPVHVVHVPIVVIVDIVPRWGLLQHGIGIARGMRGIAFIVCVASIIVAIWSALQQPHEKPVEA